MGKCRTGSRQEKRRAKTAASSQLPTHEIRVDKIKRRKFEPMNHTQDRYVNKIYNNVITFGIGPAGTGKTECAAGVAAEMFMAKEIEKIILTRPVVTVGEDLGFLPGELEEKYEPYIAPLLTALSKYLGQGHVEALVENGQIVFMPLAFIRGHTFEKAFVILDEAQNVTELQMKTFLSRIGNDTVCVIDGDVQQKDALDKKGTVANGMEDAIARLDSVDGVAVHEFTEADIVRSGIAKAIIVAYNRPKPTTSKMTDPVEEADAGVRRFLTTA